VAQWDSRVKKNNFTIKHSDEFNFDSKVEVLASALKMHTDKCAAKISKKTEMS